MIEEVCLYTGLIGEKLSSVSFFGCKFYPFCEFI